MASLFTCRFLYRCNATVQIVTAAYCVLVKEWDHAVVFALFGIASLLLVITDQLERRCHG
jgi:hypothetical protein